MKVENIVKAVNGKLIGNTDIKIEDFVKASYSVKQNSCYIAIKGERFDGNDYILEAIKNGASLIIANRELNEEEEKEINNRKIAAIIVDNSLLALKQMAKLKREELGNIPVVLITGSVGKTSTKDIVAEVVKQKYSVLKTIGNLNNFIGLPLSILNHKSEETLVLEAGMSSFGEISDLTKIAMPTIAIITNIGTAHIGNLGSKENILKAKLEILEGLVTKNVVINNDDELLNKWARENENNYNIIKYGIREKSNYNAENIQSTAETNSFDIEGETIKINVMGEHFVLNSLCAYSVGRLLGIDIKDIKKGLEEFKISSGRMEKLKGINNSILIDDCYNASLDSMKAAINYIKKIDNKKKLLILGDMLELGEFSDKIHTKVGKEIEKIDYLITVGKSSKLIFENAQVENKFSFDNNKEAIEKAKEIINDNTIILVKASHSMKFAEIVEELKQKIVVGVVYGGRSTEHSISVKSAENVFKNIDRKKFDVLEIFISENGEYYDKDGLEILNIFEYLKKCDVVFPVLHGLFGEDGTIQGMLEMLGIKYVGCNVISSAICMDKYYTKKIIGASNILQAKYICLKDDNILITDDSDEIEISEEQLVEKIEKEFEYPVFVKPVNSGSSVGVEKVRESKELILAVKNAFKYDRKILIEQGIVGKEIECAVLENGEIFVSEPGEILSGEEFYSFNAKYVNTESKIMVPASISKDKKEEAKMIAKKVFRALDCKVISRVDMFLEKETNKIYLNEINTMPGFTNISMYPVLLENEGISYSEIITKLILGSM